MHRNVLILDTTLRDGEQTPGVNLNLSEKLEIARQLERLGVDIIEAGFAAASPGDFEAVQAIARHIQSARVCSLCRCMPGDVKASAEALRMAKAPRLHVFIATSPIHLKHKLRMTEEQVLEAAVEAVKLARRYCDDVQFSAEDGTRTPIAFLRRVFEHVIAAGATTVSLADTVGYATANEFSRMIQELLTSVRGIESATLAVHCHNDLGLAAANSLIAVRHGAGQVECTVNGLGERAGNAALEEIVMGMRTRQDYYQADCRLDSRQLYLTSHLVSSLTGVEVPPNKAVVGANAFAHQSGIHQHGVMAERSTYEIMRPEDVGVPVSAMLLGKLSGRHAFAERVTALGFHLEEAELTHAFTRFKALADRKKDVTDRDIMALLSEHLTEIPTVWQFADYQLLSGNRLTATATVTLRRDGQDYTEAAIGDGPVDAALRAIDRIARMDVRLESYQIKAVTEGQDALGEVTVRISHKGRLMLGKGVSTDIIEASMLAYVNAINRFISEIARD